MLKKFASVLLLTAMLFTVSCQKAATANDLAATVAATSDTVTVSAAAMTYFYNDTVLSFLNHYAAVVDKLGLDPSKPLSEQKMNNREDTWHEYFLNSTCTLMYHLVSLNEAAKAEGTALTDAEITAITTRAQAVSEGSYGAGVNAEAVTEARLLEALAYKHQEIKEAELEPTDEEIAAYIAENKKNFKYDETATLNVRHIMLFDTSFKDHEAALDKANELLDILKADTSADAFTRIALQYSDDPSSCYAGGLYPDLAPEKSIKEVDKWCFDPTRKVGDIAVIESEYGCHIVYIEGEGRPVWQAEIASEIVSERFDKLSDAYHADYFVSFSKDALSMIK